MKEKNRKQAQKGFTLIELLIVLFISGIVLTGIYKTFFSQQSAYRTQEQVAELNQNLRAALDLMVREIRLANYKTSTSSFMGILEASPTRIRVLADLNQDGDTLDDNEDITYNYDPSSKKIWRNEAQFVLAENIIQFSFLYTLADGSTTQSPAHLGEIRKITVSITGRTASPSLGTGQYRTMTLTSDITPRNLLG
jgi:prepilin-type N-terminal cleavage/methylation domain-containing protein